MRPDANLLRTQVAQSTNVFSASFNAVFASMVLSPGSYVPEMTVPEGQSTGGGALATQKIRLVPKQPGFPLLVVGEANKSQNRAELRSFDVVDAAHREHFKRQVALDQREYAAFLAKARSFFDRQDMLIDIILPSADESKASVGGTSSGGGIWFGFLMGAVVATIVGVAVWYFGHRQ